VIKIRLKKSSKISQERRKFWKNLQRLRLLMLELIPVKLELRVEKLLLPKKELQEEPQVRINLKLNSIKSQRFSLRDGFFWISQELSLRPKQWRSL
jgi:hypothetical protein